MCKEIIADIKHINVTTLKTECSLDKWFSKMVNKTTDKLDILDISRMIRQDIYVDIALPIALKMIQDDPFNGEMYNGQLLELVERYLTKSPEYLKDFDFNSLLKKIDRKILVHIWEDDADKEAYMGTVEKFKNLITNFNVR